MAYSRLSAAPLSAGRASAARVSTALASALFVSLSAAAALAQPAGAAHHPVLGPEAAACRPGATGTAALVTVHGFKDRDGQLRIQDYTGKDGEYLESGKYLQRHDVPMTASGGMTVCLSLPGPGSYVIVALHDRDTNGKLSIWSDGIGFTGNPRLKLAKPAPFDTVIPFGAGVTPVRIVLNYRRGLSVKPLD
ncbi:hypothetical protein GCM10011529_15860 [Polymorphobacter glacialis]|uniref:DUF2141 domain-containing protein n=1 Tax=Sandarakinorhabdus glacialis TaxID=1614636 RepID=A0A916ZR62_9SPHN|nr:DUF2141 domain-containing protein [Polymorphobacter glacialis]GGE10307.1 hypothetical protein GCM10011529_15860 [Polymorphobacter glacialis]